MGTHSSVLLRQGVGGAACLTPVEGFGLEIDEAVVIYRSRCSGRVAATHVASDERSAGPV